MARIYDRENNGSLSIAPTRDCTFLELDLWSPGAGFIPFVFTKGTNQIKKEKL